MRRHRIVLLFAVGVLSCESAPTAIALEGDSRPVFGFLGMGGYAQEGGALIIVADPASPAHNMEVPNIVATEVSSQRGERETLFVGPSDGSRRVWLSVLVSTPEVTADIDKIVRTWHGRPTGRWNHFEMEDRPLGAASSERYFWVEDDARQIMRQLNGIEEVLWAEPFEVICGFGWCSLSVYGSIPVTTAAVVPGDRRFSIRDGDTLTVRYTQPDGSELRRRFALSGLTISPLP